MAAEAVGEQEARDLGVGPENGVVIQVVDIVMAGPGAGHLDGLEGGHAMGQDRPHALFETGVIDLEVAVQPEEDIEAE